MAGIVLATRWGTGVTSDSVAYLNAAENIAAGNGVVLTRTPDEHAPMVHWPPVYSVVLAAGAVLGANVFDFARLLGVAVIGGNVFLVGFVIRRYVRHDFPALIGALLVATSYGVVWVHAHALSEALFTLFCIVALAGLASYGDTSRRWLLILAASAAAGATLTRYAGVALIGAGVLTLLLANWSSIRRRLVDALLFGVVASLPVIVWQIRNGLVGAPSVGRDLSFEPFRLYHLKTFLSGLSLWLFPVEVDPYVRLSATILLLLGVAAGLFYCYRRVRYERGGLTSPTILLVSFNFIVGYWALYAVTILFADNGVSLSTRTQVPAFVLTVVFVAVLAGHVLPSDGHRRSVRRVQIAVGCCLALLASVNAAKFLVGAYSTGLGFTSDRWRKSEIIQLIKHAPQEQVIYTNLPAGVQFLAGKRTRAITGARWTGFSDSAYIARLRPIIAEVKRSNSLIYYFKTYSGLRPVAERDFAKILGLVPVSRHSDGTVYMVR